MNVDHIFIFSRSLGSEADELVDFGIAEGSSRVHHGQGTTNRKFYFENFFLEILWVHDQSEIQNKYTKSTSLWERSNFPHSNYSPFGLCLVNDNHSDQIFANPSIYQPAYFPEGTTIDFISDSEQPWIFRLPFKDQKKNTTEPLEHSQQLQKLTRTTFHISKTSSITDSIEQLSEGAIKFKVSEKEHLLLEFDHGESGSVFTCQKLPLTIKY